MMAMLGKIHKVIRAAGDRDKAPRTQLQPIDLLDIANIIGENVVSGGVRRTSEIGLIDADDQVCIKAKEQSVPSDQRTVGAGPVPRSQTDEQQLNLL